jgi:hypothetical protein
MIVENINAIQKYGPEHWNVTAGSEQFTILFKGDLPKHLESQISPKKPK